MKQTKDYYSAVPPNDSPLRPAYTLAMAQLEDSRDQWKARAAELQDSNGDLLEALRSLLQWVELETDGRDWPHAHLIAARDAIAKATGESPVLQASTE